MTVKIIENRDKSIKFTNRAWIILEIRKLENAPSQLEIQKFFSESRITLSQCPMDNY